MFISFPIRSYYLQATASAAELGAGGELEWLVGGWWLVAGGWWLVVGGWWLVVGGWWLVVGGWWLVVGGWWLGGVEWHGGLIFVDFH